jgi:flagellar FliL protein
MAKKEEKEEKDEKTVEEGSKPAGQKPLKKWIIIGAAVSILIAAGTGGVLYFTSSHGSGKSAEKPAVTAMWAMDPFIVNLIDNQGDRYLKVIIEIEVSDQNCLAELNQMKAKIRDNILDLLTAKSYKELVDIVGRQRLRDEIGMRLNNFLTKGKIVKVYFTEFVVQ